MQRFSRPPRTPGQRLALLCCAVTCIAVAPTGPASAAPDEGECPTVQASRDDGGALEDATATLLEPGMVVSKEALLALRSLLPEELWKYREIFFYDGMQMLIGPCHRRYVIPSHYRAASERFRGQARLDGDGNLEGYTAGLPFAPEDINDQARDAALKWAWNFEKRYRGPGHRGRLRIRSYPSGLGSIQTYRGSFSLLKTKERSDLAEQGYAVPDAQDRIWASGGEFVEPFSVRGLAWRQYRVEKSARRWDLPDDIFVYVPEMRKIRRAATNWVDGFYLPAFMWGGQSGGGGLTYGASGGINPSAGINIGTTEDARLGLTGLSVRPNAYDWRLRGRTVVIAPINAMRAGYPVDEERNYGFSGLSVADDRWDVRAAVVIEGALKRQNETIRTVTLYLDELTLQPLYWISRADRRRLVEVGILVHRYTGDVRDYPEVPGGSQALVFEPVAASFFNALAGRGGWMRESWDLSSLPFSDEERRTLLSSDSLMRGR